MNKKLSPGRIYNIKGVIVRAKRQFGSCKGCIFDNPFSCPRVQDLKNFKEQLTCSEDGIIFIRP